MIVNTGNTVSERKLEYLLCIDTGPPRKSAAKFRIVAVTMLTMNNGHAFTIKENIHYIKSQNDIMRRNLYGNIDKITYPEVISSYPKVKIPGRRHICFCVLPIN